MKNTTLFIAIIFATVLQLSANNIPKTNTLDVVKNEKSIVLNLFGIVNESDLITITDSNGEIVFTESLEKYEVRVKYSLKNLPDGNYTIKVEGENFVEIHEALISEDSVSLLDMDSYLRPEVSVINDKVIIEGTVNSDESIEVNILDEAGHTLYTYNQQNDGGFKKSFDLKNLKTGNYLVVVSTAYFNESTKFSL